MDINFPERVVTRPDLVSYLEALMADHQRNVDEWENLSLPMFLEAMKAWLVDTDRYQHEAAGGGSGPSPWRVAAELLRAGRSYE